MADPATPAKWRAALKAEGVPFVELEGWTTRGRDAATGKVFGPVHGILNHHTAGVDSLDVIAYRGVGASLPPPLAHALLRKDGVVVLVADGRANHAGLVAENVFRAIVAEKPLPKQDASRTVDGNDSLYGLEVENLGDGEDVYTRAQYDSWVRFDTALCRLHQWTEGSAAGHLETSVEGKPDPRGPVAGYGRRGRFTFTMAQLRADVRERLAHQANWSPPTTQETPAVTPEYVNLGLARSYRLAPDLWDDIAFTAEWSDEPDDHALNSPTFVKGAARFTGSVSLRFEGLAVGEVVQVRMSEHDDAGQVQHTHPPHEVIGTPGGTYSSVPLTKRVPAGRSMRVQLLNQGADSVEVASAVLTLLVWGE
ncbi:N-acetylmuramoyl-L-alanine amidase [Streptomyces sp. ME02-6987-2C]|uniref:N-acetylmuramoyl-L-alanine amidase n=1 Tax=unclassified Streptomyces TaxID=2593676 RepID=UPI0029B1550B|nr:MULTISPECIES: N-acetylmuramoyl-L-alanine amidase [unclassified Streptomyces]MDX3345863.1 N-acetylmuramoyl-L-alanine amidase [Streptomyces sp. ME02-6979A]MDX3367266.1 N-acetylmuramoyl-L-alanine amidase [Streptomyces sp. ME02-6987-2C]MDX3404887.1 N-acetylmuramoyl-L-alanine amidase [Streptomyces sp. ME02-6977A]MDX3421629.1 N-acetylmuramoyl-L-alanine amidase [Streptomyces sp. ME02-6985-2c]